MSTDAMSEMPQMLDDITPSKKRDGSVTLSSFAWAIHRYTMGFFLGMFAILVGVFAHDYLQTRTKVTRLETERDGAIFDQERRITELEEASANHMSAYSAIRKDQELLKEMAYQIRSDLSVLKSRMMP